MNTNRVLYEIPSWKMVDWKDVKTGMKFRVEDHLGNLIRDNNGALLELVRATSDSWENDLGVWTFAFEFVDTPIGTISSERVI